MGASIVIILARSLANPKVVYENKGGNSIEKAMNVTFIKKTMPTLARSIIEVAANP